MLSSELLFGPLITLWHARHIFLLDLFQFLRHIFTGLRKSAHGLSQYISLFAN